CQDFSRYIKLNNFLPSVDISRFFNFNNFLRWFSVNRTYFLLNFRSKFKFFRSMSIYNGFNRKTDVLYKLAKISFIYSPKSFMASCLKDLNENKFFGLINVHENNSIQ